MTSRHLSSVTVTAGHPAQVARRPDAHHLRPLSTVPSSTFDEFVEGMIDSTMAGFVTEAFSRRGVPLDADHLDDHLSAMEIDSVPQGLDAYAYAFLLSLQEIFTRCFGPLAHPSDVSRFVRLCARVIDLLRSGYVHRCGLKPVSLWGVQVDPLPEVVVPLLLAVSHTAKLLRGIVYRYRDLPAHDAATVAQAAHWPHSIAQCACYVAKVNVAVGGCVSEGRRSDAIAHGILRANTPRSVSVRVDNMAVTIPDRVGPLIVFLSRPNAHYVASDLLWMAQKATEIAEATYTPALRQRCLVLSKFYTHVSQNWVDLRAYI
jgi:hypothetical protein